MSYRVGKIIFLNGTSSAGKTTLARALQERLEEPFVYYASDQLAEKGFRSKREFPDNTPSERQRFFDGFHRSIPAFASAGNNMIVEHVVEEQSWADDLGLLLSPFDTFWVGVHAPIEELERRETLRGDRSTGEARFHLKTHQYCRYDIDIDSTRPLEEMLTLLISSWLRRAVKSSSVARPIVAMTPSDAETGSHNREL